MQRKHVYSAQALRERDEIIERIRDAMKHMEYTQNELSRELGMKTQSLNQRLTGKHEFRLIELIELCDLLGIEIII